MLDVKLANHLSQVIKFICAGNQHVECGLYLVTG